MEEFAETFSSLESLSYSIVELVNASDFEQANKLILERQVQLETLDENVKAKPNNQSLIDCYQTFLLKIQKIDQSQIVRLVTARKDLTQASLKQKKTKDAISAYKGIKF